MLISSLPIKSLKIITQIPSSLEWILQKDALNQTKGIIHQRHPCTYQKIKIMDVMEGHISQPGRRERFNASCHQFL